MEDFADSFDEDGCAILEVECGKNKAKLYAARLCQGSKGSCILFRKSWLTPNEFQFVSGRQTAKDWKKSIRHQGKSLKQLMGSGEVKLHTNDCVPERSRKTLPKKKPRTRRRRRMRTRQRAPLAENVKLKETNRDEVDQNKGINNGDGDLKKESGDIHSVQPDADFYNSASLGDSCDAENDRQSGITMQDTENSSHSEEAACENCNKSPADGLNTSFQSNSKCTSPQTSSAHDQRKTDDSSQSYNQKVTSAASKNNVLCTDRCDDTTVYDSSDSKDNKILNSEDDGEESSDLVQNILLPDSPTDDSSDNSSSTQRFHKEGDRAEKHFDIKNPYDENISQSDGSNNSLESVSESLSPRDENFDKSSRVLNDGVLAESEQEVNRKPLLEEEVSQQHASPVAEPVKFGNDDVISKETRELETISEVKPETGDICGNSQGKNAQDEILETKHSQKPNNTDILGASAPGRETYQFETPCSAPSHDAKSPFCLQMNLSEDILTGSVSSVPEQTKDSSHSKTEISYLQKYETNDSDVMKNSVDKPTAITGLGDNASGVSYFAVTKTMSAPTHSSSSTEASLKVKGEIPQSNEVSGRDDRHELADVKLRSTHEDYKISKGKETKRKSRLSTVIENLRTSKEKALESSFSTTITTKHDRHPIKPSSTKQSPQKISDSTEVTRQAMNAASLYNNSIGRLSFPAQTAPSPVIVSQHKFPSVPKFKASRDSKSKRPESRDKNPSGIMESAALPSHFPCVDNRSIEGSYLDLVHRYNMALAHQHYHEISSAFNPHLNLSQHPFRNGTTYEQMMMDPIMLNKHLVHQQTHRSVHTPRVNPSVAENSTHKRDVKSSYRHSSSSLHSATRQAKRSSQSVNCHSIRWSPQSAFKESEDALDLSFKKRKI